MGRLYYTSEVKHVNGRLALELVVIGSELQLSVTSWMRRRAMLLSSTWNACSNTSMAFQLFVDVAKLSVVKMNRLMEAGEGRRVYVDYISVIQNYLIPFFGKFNVANINHQQVSAYEQWRLERIGRVMRASTVSTHNSSFSNCANWLNWLNCAFAI